jgi:hypothetical protein
MIYLQINPLQLEIYVNYILDHRNKTGNVLTNVTFRRIRVTIVAVEKQKVLHILCVSVALVIQHAPYYIAYYLWPVWLYHIFPHYLTNGTIFGTKKLLDIKCVF